MKNTAICQLLKNSTRKVQMLCTQDKYAQCGNMPHKSLLQMDPSINSIFCVLLALQKVMWFIGFCPIRHGSSRASHRLLVLVYWCTWNRNGTAKSDVWHIWCCQPMPPKLPRGKLCWRFYWMIFVLLWLHWRWRKMVKNWQPVIVQYYSYTTLN